ncbi:MAG: hypothetical protein PHX80_05515 [Candidatus Nanoarchaeia archaeon]|nr:hypothetical protein [Candidatus Nanoarchaeia archaeon]
MNDNAKAREKIKHYNFYIHTLEREKKSLHNLIQDCEISELEKAKTEQRIFDIEVTINGHQAFIKEYQARINPTTYRKSL